jgi:acetyltransferase-like isoleucine patch superfamily enzyme
MTRFWPLLVGIYAFPRKAFNKVLNLLATAVVRQKIIIDWGDARILNPAAIQFRGSFQAGRGLWLEVIGNRGGIVIGDGARLSDYVHIGAIGNLRIGRNLLAGSKVLIIDHSHGHGYRNTPDEILVPPGERPLASRGEITIGDNVWLGDNVIVLAGVTIGDNCVVGAHSLVRTNLPANTVCGGNPARVLSAHSASETLICRASEL